MRRKYYLHKRNGTYYAELIDPVNGQKLSAKSTGERNKDNALLVVSDWLKNGVPSGHIRDRRPATDAFTSSKLITAVKTVELTANDALRIVKGLQDRGLVTGTFMKTSSTESELFVDFITRLWDWDSPFIREKRAYSHKISKRHCKDMSDLLRRYWYEKFRNIKVGEITREALKGHLLYLKNTGFSTSTLNQTLNVIAAPMAWAFREGIITLNPAAGIKRFSGKGQKRDILTHDEIRALMSLEWSDERGKIAFMVALTCGLRLGEVAALQLRDVGEDRLYVRHSWSRLDGLKKPKNNEERETPLLPIVRNALRKLGASNPWGMGDDRYIFYSAIKNQPLDSKILSDQFNQALNMIGIEEKVRKERQLVFHGLRHSFTKSISSHIDQQTAMRATGHKSAVIFARYADHKTEEEFNNLIAASENVWGEFFMNDIDKKEIQ